MIAGGVAKRQKERHTNGVKQVQRAEKRRKQFIRLRTNRAICQVQLGLATPSLTSDSCMGDGVAEQATPAGCSPSLPHTLNFKHGHPLPPQSDTNATDGRGQWNAVFISLPEPEKQMPRAPYLPPTPPTLHPERPSLICIISKANGYKLFAIHWPLSPSSSPR